MEGTETFGEQPAPAVKKPKAKATKKKKAAKPKAKKVAKKKPAKKAKAKTNGASRPERLDLRLTTAEKKKLAAKAKATRRTITSVVQELIERMK